jgi:FtsZ-binding cell division protein ZapB
LQEKIDGITDEKTVLEQLNKDLQDKIELLETENQTLKEQCFTIKENKVSFAWLRKIFNRKSK